MQALFLADMQGCNVGEDTSIGCDRLLLLLKKNLFRSSSMEAKAIPAFCIVAMCTPSHKKLRP